MMARCAGFDFLCELNFQAYRLRLRRQREDLLRRVAQQQIDGRGLVVVRNRQRGLADLLRPAHRDEPRHGPASGRGRRRRFQSINRNLVKNAPQVDGQSYNFLSDDRFDSMVAAGEFIEWARVGGNRYGTAVRGVREVSERGQICLMDLDVQGVESIVARDDLRPYCIWVAPPSLDALRERMRGRGEASDEIERRIKRATDEIEFSLAARCFDKIVLNEDLEQAYTTLKASLDGVQA